MAGPAARPALTPRHPALERGYESFYVRAADPARPRSLWLRHTVHKSAEGTFGSVWATLFDRDAEAPAAHKHTEPGPPPPFGADGVRGEAGPLRYDLRWTGAGPPLRHLPADWLYRAPLPRTKLESPLPAATLTGEVAIGDASFTLDGWPGMVGHNWGSQHAERWIWLHGTAFADQPDAWLDLALGRVKVGPATTPWVANGALHVGGRRLRLGGPRRVRVREDPLQVQATVPVAGGGRLELTAQAPRAHTVVWRYADPDGGEHHTSNCSVAALDVLLRPSGGAPLALATGHGGAYELGMRETTHGLPVQPFSDP